MNRPVRSRLEVDEPDEFPLLGSLSAPPDIRARLHVICALYSHARSPASRLAVLEQLEQMALEAAQVLAVELLENGWRPD